MYRQKEFYLHLLAHALIEIRSATGKSAQEGSIKIANMMHNIPEALCLPWTPDRDERTYQDMRSKAEDDGLLALLDGWERSALRRIGQPSDSLTGV